MMKKRVAVMGGGMGSLAAAFALTSHPGWDAEYEVTVYQMGWRLGGKGASGRRASEGQRIEEHGLHVWLGFYDNAFKVIRAAYAERKRRPDDPFVSWADAFKKHDLVVLMEHVADKWTPGRSTFPRTISSPAKARREGSPRCGRTCSRSSASSTITSPHRPSPRRRRRALCTCWTPRESR